MSYRHAVPRRGVTDGWTHNIGVDNRQLMQTTYPATYPPTELIGHPYVQGINMERRVNGQIMLHAQPKVLIGVSVVEG